MKNKNLYTKVCPSCGKIFGIDNEKHGTCYSYGQMTYLIDSGRISRKEFLKH